jgi:hypothetical protein
VRKASLLTAFAFLGAVAGCAPSLDSPVDTGARATAHVYFQALLQRDWQGAYAQLAPASRAACSETRFARLAEQYRRQFGFEPEAVYVRACEEHASDAVAHIVFTGSSGGRQHFYRDGIVLCRADAAWHVVLQPRFGEAPLSSR